MNIDWISKITKESHFKTSRIEMTNALVKKGHTVTLYMAKKFGEKSFISNNIKFIPTIPFPILSGFFYGLIVFFYFPILMSRKKVDVIVIDCTQVWLPFIIPLKILNIPLILDIRTLPIGKNKTFSFKVTIYLSRHIVDGITTITPELSMVLKNVYNLKNIKVGIWSSGVSIDMFNKKKNKKCTLLKLRDGRFTLIYHGGYGTTRGVDNLIKAISELNFELKNNIRLLIIGMNAELIKYLSKIRDKEGVKEQVDILPRVEYQKIPEYIQIADAGIFCLPPNTLWWRVSAPLKSLECLAAGKPIIVTNIPFHSRLFEKGNCGIILESNDPKVVAKGISYLYKNQKDLKKIGREGKKIVKKYYTWDYMAQKFEDYLINCIMEYKNDKNS